MLFMVTHVVSNSVFPLTLWDISTMESSSSQSANYFNLEDVKFFSFKNLRHNLRLDEKKACVLYVACKMRVLFVVMLIFGVIIAPRLAIPQSRSVGDVNSTISCICTAPKCTGENPDYECGIGKVCKDLAACGWRCQGGFLQLCVAI
ncbi:hypothetical protein Fcan01_25806 [Folsomia candida]|uniref:Uncharacterized protein n=1 Tax=Folsomia candida TaxID=158441 RepID=A0A226D1M3_FOLCA|nr:hypothetical protein Fcan01_25806 [Folsomia candida]